MLDHHTAILDGANLVWPKDAVIPDSLQVREIAEERIRELKRLRERGHDIKLIGEAQFWALVGKPQKPRA